MTNQEKVNYIFETLVEADVAVSHLASMARVSRNTLQTWKRGASGFDDLHLSMAYGVAKRLGSAVHLGRLPLKDKVIGAEKVKILNQIIRDIVR